MPEGSGVTVRLERHHAAGVLPPWGFRIHGGKDFSHHLTVLRISPGSIADRYGLRTGDVIEQINGKDATKLLHLDAQQLIKESGDVLELVVGRQVDQCGIFYRGINKLDSTASHNVDASSPKTQLVSETAQPAYAAKTNGEPTPADKEERQEDRNVDYEAGESAADTGSITTTSEASSNSPRDVTDGAADTEVELTTGQQDRIPSSPDEPPPPARSPPVPDFHVKPAPVEQATLPSWMEHRPEPVLGRTMKMLQKRLSTGEAPASSLQGNKENSTSELTSPEKTTGSKPFVGSTLQVLQQEEDESGKRQGLSQEKPVNIPSKLTSPEKTTGSKPFVSSTLQVLQQEEEERKRQGLSQEKPVNVPSKSVETPSEPPLGRTMRLLQQQLHIGGDNPLPSVLSPDYSKTHARPRSWGPQGRPSPVIQAPKPKTFINRQPPEPETKCPEPVAKPAEPPKSNPQPSKPNIGSNYRYYAGLKPTPEQDTESPKEPQRRTPEFEKKRRSLDSMGSVGKSKVFDTWTGVWKEPEPSRLGTYQHTDKVKSIPNASAGTTEEKKEVQPKIPDEIDGKANGEADKPSCASCQQPLRGPFVSAIGKSWCPEHFTCHYCNINLASSQFIEEEGKVYCQEDYEMLFSPRCATCNEAISGNAVNAIGKSFHPACFVCAKCKKPFEGDSFMLEKGEPYCQKDYDEMFAVMCGRCLKPITGGDRYIEALHKEWHVDCFGCSVCNVKLEGAKFFVVNGQPHCHDHKGTKQ